MTWPEWQDVSANGPCWEDGSTAARWMPDPEGAATWPGCRTCTTRPGAFSSEEEVTAGLTALKQQADQRAAVLDAWLSSLSAADVREAMTGIYAEGEWWK